ncbi:hypothetical protein ACP4OV_014550 [Aristida adscensionis]
MLALGGITASIGYVVNFLRGVEELLHSIAFWGFCVLFLSICGIAYGLFGRNRRQFVPKQEMDNELETKIFLVVGDDVFGHPSFRGCLKAVIQKKKLCLSCRYAVMLEILEAKMNRAGRDTNTSKAMSAFMMAKDLIKCNKMILRSAFEDIQVEPNVEWHGPGQYYEERLLRTAYSVQMLHRNSEVIVLTHSTAIRNRAFGRNFKTLSPAALR